MVGFYFHCVSILLSSLAWLSVSLIAQKIGPHYKVLGSPCWNYHLCILAQLFVFPAILIPAWASKQFLPEWFEASWDSYPSMKYEWSFIYCLSGYLLKDFFVEMDFMLYVHHFVCLAGTISWIFITHKGISYFIVYTVVLELGSLSYNLWTLSKQSKLMAIAYVMIMTVSNTLAIAILIRFCLLSEPPVFLKTVFLAATIGLTVMREKVCLESAVADRQCCSQTSLETRVPRIQTENGSNEAPSGI